MFSCCVRLSAIQSLQQVRIRRRKLRDADGLVSPKERRKLSGHYAGGGFSYFFVAIHGSIADRAVSPPTSTSNTCNYTGLLLDRSVNFVCSQSLACNHLASFRLAAKERWRFEEVKWQATAHNSLVTSLAKIDNSELGLTMCDAFTRTETRRNFE
jgi:hypothetical protein